ncbi:MAG: alpha amylase catalytic region [Neobacillus sp.]|nr:alpha amylase catalytic region [Neobacillus sp.]
MKKILIISILLFSLLFSVVPTYAATQKPDRQWQDETVYSLMVDRFNDGDTQNDSDVNTQDPLAYAGGDLQGIIDKLDYLKDMGFTAIRLTSIFDNTAGGYHGYWVNDFYKIDEHFGSLKTFMKLVKEAHERELKVMIDFVTNNVSAEHPWVNDPEKQSWFHKQQDITDLNNQQEMETGWVNDLPDLNQDNPEVESYLIEAAKWWINNTGIDGYSLPEVNHVPVSFWSDFSKAVKDEKENFFLVGVGSQTNDGTWEKYEAAGIDSVYDYSYSNKLREVFATTDKSFESLEGNHDKFQQPELTATFFDNENTVRFTSDIVEQKMFPGSRWRTALAYLYSTPGIPMVFYGSEIALNGEEAPDNHRLMNFRTEKELIDYITKLGELRNQLPSLTRGTMEMLYDKDGMVVYKRSFQDETSIIAINNTSKSQNITLTKEDIETGKELRGLLKDDLVRSKDDKYEIIIDRDEAEYYVLANKSGLNLTLIGSLVVVYILVMVFLILIKKRSRKNGEV